MPIVKPYRSSIIKPYQPLPNTGLIGHGLIGLWSMGEGGGTTVFDALGTRNAIYEGSSPTWGNSYVPYITLDGSTNYLNCGTNQPFFDIVTTGGFSVLCWVYPTAFSNSYNTLGFSEGGGSAFDWEILIKSTGVPAMYFSSGDQDPSGTVALTLNKWNHVGFSLGPRSGLNVYINGVITANSGFGSYNLSTHAAYHTYFGGNSEFNSRWFTGRLGPCAVWQRELGADEVGILYRDPEALYAPTTNIWGVKGIAPPPYFPYPPKNSVRLLYNDELSPIEEWTYSV